MAPVNGTHTAKNCTDPGKKYICLSTFRTWLGLEMVLIGQLQLEPGEVILGTCE